MKINLNKPVLISACLAGICCRYDGQSKPNLKIIEIIKKGKAILVCPEQLGGLATPRVAAEICNKKVITKDGKDVTISFINGAKEVLKIAKLFNCKQAILKSKSPSCGIGQIYDGSFSGRLISGNGICAEILIKNGIKVFSEKDL